MILQKAVSLTGLNNSGIPQRDTVRRQRARGYGKKSSEAAQPTLVLASGSPRRMSLLAQIGIEPTALRPTSVDETPKRAEIPRRLAHRLARSKAQVARDQIADDAELADAYVLAADTVVSVGRRVLGKPSVLEEAIACLELLSGRSHRVTTAVCLITPKDLMRTKIVETRIRFRRLSREEIEAYIASREWRGKAGGYAIQGVAGCFVQRLVGSYSNVVGLPLTEVANLLISEKMPIHHAWPNAAEIDIE